jgi:hypothetical protein
MQRTPPGWTSPLSYDTGSSFLQGMVGTTTGSVVGVGTDSFQRALSQSEMQSLVDNSGVQGTQKNALDAFVNSGDNFTSQANADGTITVTNDATGATITVSTGQGGVDVMDQLANGVDNVVMESIGDRLRLTDTNTGRSITVDPDETTFKDMLDFSNGLTPPGAEPRTKALPPFDGHHRSPYGHRYSVYSDERRRRCVATGNRHAVSG